MAATRIDASIPQTGKDKPIIVYLNRHVTTRVCGTCSNPEVWRDLGRELLGQEAESELNTIAVNSYGNVILCCSSMFSLWLERQPGASWKQLITALINVNLVSLATEIEKSLTTTPSEQQQDTQQILTNVQAGPLGHGSVLAQKVQMWELTKIVIPRIRGHWKELAYCMRYGIGEVEAFDKEGKSNLYECCEKLFVNWLTTSHGPEPKTYETLLNHIKKIDTLTTESEAIEKELIEGKDK